MALDSCGFDGTGQLGTKVGAALHAITAVLGPPEDQALRPSIPAFHGRKSRQKPGPAGKASVFRTVIGTTPETGRFCAAMASLYELMSSGDPGSPLSGSVQSLSLFWVGLSDARRWLKL
jgi:hypothetical protein